MTEKSEKSVQDLMDVLGNIIKDGFKSLAVLSLLEVYRAAFQTLRQLIKTGGQGITWKHPFISLNYGVELLPEDVADQFFAENAKEKLPEDTWINLADRLLAILPDASLHQNLFAATRGVSLVWENGVECGYPQIFFPPELQEEVNALPEDKRPAKLKELAKGYRGLNKSLTFSGTATTPAGLQTFKGAYAFIIRPLIVDRKRNTAYILILAGIEFTEGDPSAWTEEEQENLWTDLFKALETAAEPYLRKLEGTTRQAIPKPDRVLAVRPEDFPVAGGYVRPIYGLSEKKKDLPLLLDFHKPQTPINWAVGLALFSLTDEDLVQSGDWQEAKIRELEDRVFCLTETGALRHGQHREDILAEVVKLHTTRNWYFEIDTVRVGRAWTKRATIGSQYAIPELQLVFIDSKTGDRVFPADAAVRALMVPLEVKGRRVFQPDGTDIPALPKGRWKLESVRWRWAQSFNEDLLLTPALEESGKRKGLPKKNTKGKPIRKGYLIRVADNIFAALTTLRSEGSGSLYACRLLIMLAGNLHKTEDGIAADRLFRMLGIPEDYARTAHEKPEDLVARAVKRLKKRDIMALLPGSDEYPRKDRNPERRKAPFYRFIRSPKYTPRTTIAPKEDVLAIEAEYESGPPPSAPAVGPSKDQAFLPGMEAPPIPSGPDIRAAREAAGITLRDFARMMEGPSFKTWSNYENEKPIRTGSVPPEVWSRVREFIARNGPKTDQKLTQK